MTWVGTSPEGHRWAPPSSALSYLSPQNQPAQSQSSMPPSHLGEHTRHQRARAHKTSVTTLVGFPAPSRGSLFQPTVSTHGCSDWLSAGTGAERSAAPVSCSSRLPRRVPRTGRPAAAAAARAPDPRASWDGEATCHLRLVPFATCGRSPLPVPPRESGLEDGEGEG